MCANVNQPNLPPSQDAGKGRSLLARLTQPLRSRTKNLNDFHIDPDEPHRKYSPGDVVKGAVVLEIVKPIRITHLTVALYGFVRVYKHPNGVGDHFETAVIRGTSNRAQYHGNGHASLFQDEQTLCGEGRLDVGIYKFNFELEFPSKELPSSIDFERGTISYMISATITRPTSIGATSTCDRKISLVETVDIGPMSAVPKARNITLEPIAKRAKKRPPTKRESKTDPKQTEPTTAEGGGSGSERISTPQPDESASQRDSNEINDAPQSPTSSHCPSDVSGGSAVSNGTGLSFTHVPSSKSGRDSKSSFADKTITATIQVMKAGCLPGETIPIKISIQHTKVVRSLNGIIVTFYRQGRIDSSPPLSLFKDLKGKEAERVKHEEYYPKSKTGLGGLSLSSAGSSSVFRKDLSQTFAPLLIDPGTLSTEVKASIRVPDYVFPTIKGVPGQMISFKYHVEVVVDLGGKLAGQDRLFPRLGITNSQSMYGGGPERIGRDDGNAAMLAALGGSIIDTSHIRRERSVVACVFEVVVGTTDSHRRRGTVNSTVTRHDSYSSPEALPSPLPYEQNQQEHWYDESYENQPNTYQQNHDGYYQSGSGAYDYPPEEPEPYHEYPDYAHQQHPTAPIPQPNYEHLDEKTRLRLAEEGLYPSQPPTADEEVAVAGPSNSSERTIGRNYSSPPVPSAPPASSTNHGQDPTGDSYTTSDLTLTPHLATMNVALTLTSTSTSQDIQSHPLMPIPSAPTLDDIDLPDSSMPSNYHPGEDKQELERRRLMNEASAPSDFPDDSDFGEGSGSGSGQRARLEPSAPVLSEEDEFRVIYGGSGNRGRERSGSECENEDLPRYER